MEAVFVDSRFAQHNDRLKHTVQFIPVKSPTADFLETEICEDRLLVIQEDECPADLEITFRVNPTVLRIAGISVNIANVPKCEIYTGSFLEYDSMATGLLQEDMPELDVYKYDFNFSQKSHSAVSLKFKPTQAELLIFGIDCFVCPPGPGSRPSGTIDLQHVEEMLAQSSLGISEAAEKFLKVALTKPIGGDHHHPSPSVASTSASTPALDPGVLQLFDTRLREMEERLMTQIDLKFKALELSQEAHFQRILDRLEGQSN